MASVGSVRIGTKHIDIQAFTGEVMDTSRDNKFVLANGRGQHAIEVSERVMSISRGQKVTGFWGVVRGRDSDWLALFNHDTGKWAWFRPTRDKLAGPPLNQLLIIIAVFAGVFGVFSLFGSPVAAISFLAMSGAIVWRVQQRRKTLMGAVTTALTTVRMEA